jgi:thiol:disulfide interchange protein DsbD
MNKVVLSLGIVLIVLIGIVIAMSQVAFKSTGNDSSQDNSQVLQWNTNLDSALQEAKNTNKSVFVDFHADWCAYCQKMDEGTYTDSQVKEKLTQDYVLVKVNVDENQNLSSKYQAYSLPTMVILDSDGNEIKRIIGYQSSDQLLSQI